LDTLKGTLEQNPNGVRVRAGNTEQAIGRWNSIRTEKKGINGQKPHNQRKRCRREDTGEGKKTKELFLSQEIQA